MGAAVMTVTHVTGARGDMGTIREDFYDLTFSGTTDTYVTGGFTIAPADAGMVGIIGVIPISFRLAAGTARTSSWLPQWDGATGKIQPFGSHGAAPAPPAQTP